MSEHPTDEDLWAGAYGITYTTKFAVDWKLRIDFMRSMLEIAKPRRVLDVGCNAGWNMMALIVADPTLTINGVEINYHTAVSAACMGFPVMVGKAREAGKMFEEKHDLVITSGLLIHVPPHQLEETMRSIIEASKRWVLCVEYDSKEETVLRQQDNSPPRIWSRPYGELYRKLGLELVASGSPGPGYPDCSYWLLRK